MKLQCDGLPEKKRCGQYFGSYGRVQIKRIRLKFTCNCAAYCSDPKFYGWLAMMGKDVHILKPKENGSILP